MNSKRDTETHIIPGDAIPVRRGQYRALCGRLVDDDQHVRTGDPTCPDCKRIDDDDAEFAARQGWV